MLAQTAICLVIGIPIAGTLGMVAIYDDRMGNTSCTLYMGFDKIIVLFYDLYLVVLSEFLSILQTGIEASQALWLEGQATVEIIPIQKIIA